MDAPVTRREMHEALEIWAGAIIEKVTASVTESVMARVNALFEERDARLTAELTHQIRASAADTHRYIAALDDKYRDLPARVTRLETKVFAPKRKRATAARRKRS